MSKAKELAIKIRRYIDRRHTSWYFGGVRHELYELLEIILADDAVLSEPDAPDLKGWIEEGEKPKRRLLHLLSDKVLIESEFDYCRMVYFHRDEDISTTIEESYDSIKQKIARAG